MKAVWILNHYATYPEETGGTRHYQLARHLREQGWKAVLIAASVEHPSGRQRLKEVEKVRLDEFLDVSFLWLRTSSYRGNGSGRMKNMLEYLFQALHPARLRALEKPDLIIGSSVHPFAAFAGWWLARRHGVPFIFEVRDLWPQTLIDMGRLKKNSITAVAMRALETFLYRRAHRILTLLPRAIDYIQTRNVPAERVVWLPNGVDLDDYPYFISSDQFSFKKQFTLMYFGSHGDANGLEVLIHAMSIVHDRNKKEGKNIPVCLRMIGDGPSKPALERLAAALNLNENCIKFESPVPKREIPNLAQQADAFVIAVRDLPELYRFGISMNKLFDYMAAARPVIIASAAVNNPVKDAGAGLTVPPENPKELAEAILELIQMSPQELAFMGRAGRRHVAENYSYKILAERLANVMDKVLEEEK